MSASLDKDALHTGRVFCAVRCKVKARGQPLRDRGRNERTAICFVDLVHGYDRPIALPLWHMQLGPHSAESTNVRIYGWREFIPIYNLGLLLLIYRA